MKNFVIVGAGGFGREVYSWLQDWIVAETERRYEFQVKGFLSLDKTELDGFNLPVPILGNEQSYDLAADDLVVLALGQIHTKKRAVKTLLEAGAKFFTLIHPTAVVCKTVTIGEGCVFAPFTLVSGSHVSLGNYVMLNGFSSVGHDAKVGDYSILCPYATLNGFVTLENEVFIGTHATVVANKTVGAESRICANALVVSNVPEKTTVIGSPGKMMPNLN